MEKSSNAATGNNNGKWFRNGNPLEKDIEKYLKICFEKMGGQCWKFTSPGRNGVPDRIAFIPNGWIFFIELKKKRAKPSPIQRVVHKMLLEQGHKVYVLDSIEAIDELIFHIHYVVDMDGMKADKTGYYDKFHQQKRIREFHDDLQWLKEEDEL